MSNQLDEINALLNQFEKELEEKKIFYEEMRFLNPSFEEMSAENFQEKHCRCWLHGATEVIECDELERWLYDKPSLSKTARSPAIHFVRAWREWLSIKEAHYDEYKGFEFEDPKEGEILIDFILRMAAIPAGHFFGCK